MLWYNLIPSASFRYKRRAKNCSGDEGGCGEFEKWRAIRASMGGVLT